MSDKPENLPAFPQQEFARIGKCSEGKVHGGITMREYFAAAALPALIQARTTLTESDPENFADINRDGWGEVLENSQVSAAETLAYDAYAIADEMIAKGRR